MTSSCPNWAALARERERAELGPEIGDATIDEAWRQALQHRIACERCRRDALLAEPLLLLSAGRTDVDAAGDEAAVDAIRRRVKLHLAERDTKRRLETARQSRRRWPLASMLAAGLVVAALSVSLLPWPDDAPAEVGLADPETAAVGARELPAHLEMAPLVEPLGDEPMRVYQLPGSGQGGDLDVVLVVAEVAP